MDRIGVIGLGTMGEPIVRHLLQHDRCSIVYDASEGAMASIADEDVKLASGAADVFANADVVLLLLPGSDEVEQVLFGHKPGDSSDRLGDTDIVVDMTTSAPSATDSIGRRLDDQGIGFLSAPISGGEAGAISGELTVIVGGDSTTLSRCRPVFDTFAEEIIHVGTNPQDGHIVKLLNNFLSFSAFVLTSEAVAVGRSYGIETSDMLRTFNTSTGRNSATEHKFPQYVETGTYDSGAPLSILQKDLGLFSVLTDDAGADLFLGEVVEEVVGQAAKELGNEVDHTHLFEYVEESIFEEQDGR